MLLDIIKQFNWVDLFIIIVLFRIGYVSMKSGFTAEIFKLPGTILAIYLALHYYTALGDIVRKYVSEDFMPLEFMDFICFVVLVLLGYLLFLVLREAFSRFLKLEAIPIVNKWCGLVLGVARAILLVGLLTFMLFISSADYLKESVQKSYSGVRLIGVAPDTYRFVLNNFIAKFWPAEKYNTVVTEVESSFADYKPEGEKKK